MLHLQFFSRLKLLNRVQMWQYYIKNAKRRLAEYNSISVRLKMCLQKKLVVILLFLAVVSKISAAAFDGEISGNSLGRGLDTKSLLTSLASNFISSRGYYGVTGAGSSQIVSLNLTNLLVLVLLKALIFAAGSLGAGHWKGGYARSADGEDKFITDEEVLMFLSYLAGSPGCLKNIACQQPEQAKKYIAAGDLLLRVSKMFSVHMDVDYGYILQEMEEASRIGEAGGVCQKFECGT